MEGGIPILTLEKLSEHRNRILGYIRINTLTDIDYKKISEKFQKIDLVLPDTDVDVDEWLYYKANSFIFDYYHSKEKKYKALANTKKLDKEELHYYKKLKLKCIDLYIKILESEIICKKKYRPKYTFVYSPSEDDILHDFLFVYEDVIQDLFSINFIESRPHERLVFCYKNFITGWASRDIVYRLRKKELEKILIDFVNEYSKETGLPNIAVLFYFYPLEEELHITNTGLSKLNSYFSPIDLKKFFTSYKRDQFIKDILAQRANLIDKWCERIRQRIIHSIVNL